MDGIKIRRAQLIAPFGIGGIINSKEGDSFMVCGLDRWEKEYGSEKSNYKEFIISEPRLQRRLGVDEFRLPPDFREKNEGVNNTDKKIPVVRFPRWYYCTYCGQMELLTYFSGPAKCQNNECKGIKRKDNFLKPVRFVTTCSEGHMDDFPFLKWVHKKKDFDDNHKLEYRASGASSLSGIFIVCKTCGAMSSLAGALTPGALKSAGISCKGSRPWLADQGNEDFNCPSDDSYSGIQRGASNAYFPLVYSSIYIPEDEGLTFEQSALLEERWPKIKGFITTDTHGNLNPLLIEQISSLLDMDVEIVTRFIEAKQGMSQADLTVNLDAGEEKFREAEYLAITTNSGTRHDEFHTREFNINEYDSPVQNYFDRIILVERLRETRAFVGFNRLIPEDSRSLYQKRNELSIRPKNWLPSYFVRGEGIFLKFNAQMLENWEADADVINHFKRVKGNYQNYRRERGVISSREIKPGFVLLHSFAHALINEFSFEAGYGSAALRERVYYNNEEGIKEMHGILIYTSSGDSEGTLGGLVYQGRPGRFERIILSALSRAEWCSADPVCMQIKEQGPGGCNGAACHNCLLLPETSCEEFNILLDRALITGTLNNSKIGYFQK